MQVEVSAGNSSYVEVQVPETTLSLPGIPEPASSVALEHGPDIQGFLDSSSPQEVSVSGHVEVQVPETISLVSGTPEPASSAQAVVLEHGTDDEQLAPHYPLSHPFTPLNSDPTTTIESTNSTSLDPLILLPFTQGPTAPVHCFATKSP